MLLVILKVSKMDSSEAQRDRITKVLIFFLL